MSGTYSLDGEKITTPAVAGTGTGCPNGDIPYEELMAVVVAVHRRGETLTFEGVDGEFVLELTAVS